MMNIILIGHKSAGKTTVGTQLAKELRLTFVDSDALLMQPHHPKQTTANFYQQVGETEFRKLESQIIQSLNLLDTIIAIGGGALQNKVNARHLKQLGQLIYLYTPFTILTTRNKPREQQGILANTVNPHEQYQMRDKIYRSYADKTINCENKSVEDIIKEIIDYDSR